MTVHVLNRPELLSLPRLDQATKYYDPEKARSLDTDASM